MKKLFRVLLVAMLPFILPASPAQEKPKSGETPKAEEKARTATPLKVQVVLAEYDGERKVASLPYTFLVSTDEDRVHRNSTSLRMGVRVPVVTGGKEGSTQVQYMDVGSNIDCRAFAPGEGRFGLDLSIERSSVYSNPPANESKSSQVKPDEIAVSEDQPVIRQFRASLLLILKDGQTVESLVSTDPLSGRVLRVSVTLNVVK